MVSKLMMGGMFAASIVTLSACGGAESCLTTAGAIEGCSTVTDVGTTPGDGSTSDDAPAASDDAAIISGAIVDEVDYVEQGPGNADDVIVLTGAGFDGFGQYVRDLTPARNTANFLAFENARGQRDYKMVYSQLPSGELRVFAVATDNYIDTGDFIASFERDVDRDAPLRGFADFTGDYAGYIIGIGNTDMAEIRGQALIEFDFEQEYVEGSIFNRTVIAGVVTGRDTNTDPLNPITLGRATLNADGTFAGTVGISRNGEVAAEGIWQGTMGGSNGALVPSETVGFVNIDGQKIDNITNATTKEIGVFAATCDPARDGTLCTAAPLPNPLPIP